MTREVVLETQRLVLRRFGPEDARLLFDLDSDPDVMRFISFGQNTPLERIEKEILPRILSYHHRQPPQGVWAACLRETDEFIGWFHLRPDKFAPGEMELGYRLRRAVWGRGYATEGSRALLAQGFEKWNFEKICARALEANAASQRVMQKAGLRFEGRFIYPPETIPGAQAEDLKAVKYSLDRNTRFSD